MASIIVCTSISLSLSHSSSSSGSIHVIFYLSILFLHPPPNQAAAGLEFIYSQRGRPLLVVDNFLFRKNRGSYWRCIRCTKNRCKCRLILRPNRDPIVVEKHSHGPETEKIMFGRTVRTTMSSRLFEGLTGLSAAAAAEAAAEMPAESSNDNGSTGWIVRQVQQRRRSLAVPEEPVQLFVRQPHFDTDQFVVLDASDASEQQQQKELMDEEAAASADEGAVIKAEVVEPGGCSVQGNDDAIEYLV